MTSNSMRATFRNDCVRAVTYRVNGHDGDRTTVRHDGWQVIVTRWHGGCWELSGAPEPVLREVQQKILGKASRLDRRKADLAAGVIYDEAQPEVAPLTYHAIPASLLRGLDVTGIRVMHEGETRTVIAKCEYAGSPLECVGIDEKFAYQGLGRQIDAARNTAVKVKRRKETPAEYAARHVQYAQDKKDRGPGGLTHNPFASLRR